MKIEDLRIKERLPEAEEQEALTCYDGLKARGRNSCAGCHLDFYCPMAAETTRWLVETFLPAIDPAGLVLRGQASRKGGLT